MSSTYAYLLVGGATQFSLRTAWLKLKYPAGQNEISRQPCEIFIPKFLGLNGKAPATILTSTLYTTMSRELCLNATSHFKFSTQSESIGELKKVLQLI